MKITNKQNLPAYLADWLEKSDSYDHNYDPFTFSATSLMKPIKASVLATRYVDKIEIDVTDLIASRLGSSIHDSIEKIETKNVSKENRVSRKVKIGDVEFTVTGKYDILVNENELYTLRDIKTTSVWAYIFGGKDKDYSKQLSIYRWLLSLTYNMNDKAYIDFIFTDWQSSKAKQDKEYPQQRIIPGYEIKLMSLEETEKYIIERLNLYYQHINTPDDQLPACTKEELWAQEDTFAVMKPGNQKATKVCSSKQEADIYIKDKDIKAFVEFRQGKVKRCKYCPASPFCNAYDYYLANGLIDF